MHQSQFAPNPQKYGRPRCRRCGTAMWLVRIEADKEDHDKRTFECPSCNSVKTEVVKYK